MAEVMACGTPVLKLRRGVVPDVVKHGVTSYICDIIDERVEHVEHIGMIDLAKCNMRMKAHYSADFVVERYIAVYKALVRAV